LGAVLKSLDKAAHSSILRIPEMDAYLTCEYDGEFPAKVSSIVIRRNEIGVSEAKPNFNENVLSGKVVAREYRGSVTDHRIKIGTAEIIATTHKFGNDSDARDDDAVYVHVPPRAVKPLAN